MKRLTLMIAAAALMALVTQGAALAQTTQPQAGQQEQTTTKSKRPRSPAQQRNDQILRDCGAEWRANKAAGKTGSQTWIGYLGECRKRKSA